jgi:5-methyltetrahydrofolate--homocysteine methyltransferase
MRMARSLSAILDAVPLSLGLPPRAVLDGGMGTALIARGLDVRREPTEAWNLDRGDAVREVHRRFVAVGCRVIQTNTFGGNRLRLRTFGREGELEAMNRAAVDHAIAEARDAIVVGSMGPSGLAPQPEGTADLHELEDAFAEQAAALVGAGLRLLHLETFSHPKELRAALRGVRAGAPGTAVIGSFACMGMTGSGRIAAGAALRTPAGFTADAMINVLIEEAADGVGVNCCIAPEAMRPLVVALARAGVPIVAQPIPAPEGQAPLLPGEFALGVVDLFDAGAAAVGGCCGTGPGDLEAVRVALG